MNDTDVTTQQIAAERAAAQTDDATRAAEKRGAAATANDESRVEAPAAPKAKAERHTRRTT